MNALFALLFALQVSLSNPAFVDEVAWSPSSGGCSTSDTTMLNDELIEGWSGDGTENTWSTVGSGGKITVNADTTALTTGKVAGQCNSGFKLDNSGGSGTEEFYRYDFGTAFDVDSQAVDVRLMIYVTEHLDTNLEAFTVFSFNPTDTASATLGASLTLITDGSVMQVNARGSTQSNKIALTTGSWNEIHIHYGTSTDSTGDRSYLSVNGGAADYFIRSTGGEDLRCLNVGAVLGLESADACVVYIDSVCVHTP